jgi:hypothetical protein
LQENPTYTLNGSFESDVRVILNVTLKEIGENMHAEKVNIPGFLDFSDVLQSSCSNSLRHQDKLNSLRHFYCNFNEFLRRFQLNSTFRLMKMISLFANSILADDEGDYKMRKSKKLVFKGIVRCHLIALLSAGYKPFNL